MSQDLGAKGREGRVGLAALAFGLLADGLLRVSPWGANAGIWLSLLVLACWRFMPRGPARKPGRHFLLITAVLFAAAAAGRASPVLVASNLTLSAACLLFAAIAVR